jgi:hypothetical protein
VTLPDRIWINQFDPAVLGMHVYVRGQIGDPDSNLVHVTMVNESTGAPVFTSRAATRTDVGAYEITLTSEETEVIGPFQLTWTYALSSITESVAMAIQVGEFSPEYAALSDGMKFIVEQGWNRFEDLFDSPLGGPNLQVYAQSHFNRARIAQLLRFAVGRLNTAAQPYQTYTLDGDGGATFPIATWGALLEQALYCEILKHLRRSYVEQPLLQGGEVTRHDRRDYMDRWSQVLSDEQQQLKEQLDVFKIRAMGLGRPAVLVSGGAYGRAPSGIQYMGTRGRPRFYRPGLY